jgi:hypothetical protein
MDLLATAQKRFARLAGQYRARKAQAESLVRSWSWATKEVWHINPLYFEMNGERPGRRLNKKPAGRAFYSFGFDDSGRMVVQRRHNEFGCYETFYDWSKDPVEIAHFDYDKSKKPINLCLAKYVDGRLVQTATSAIVESYAWAGPHLTRIQIRVAERVGKVWQKLEDYQVVKPSYDSDGSVQRVVIDWLPRPPHVTKLHTEVVFQRRDKPVKIDLRKDMVDVRHMLEVAVDRYAARSAARASAKRHPPVTLIELIFSLADGRATPWVHLCLDTAVELEGGTYTHPDFAKLLRKRWLPAVQAVCDGGKAGVIMPDGKKATVGGNKLLQVIGQFLASCLLLAKKDGIFADLPHARRCQLGVEDPTTGEFGWPKYADRGKKNLL